MLVALKLVTMLARVKAEAYANRNRGIKSALLIDRRP
jgi:hypothetical protein